MRGGKRLDADGGGNQLRDILRNRNFNLLWLGTGVSTIGDEAYQIAVMWYVLETTGSPLATGVVAVIAVASQIVIGPFAGVVADKVSRRLVMFVADLFSGVIVCVGAALLYMDRLGLATIYILTFLLVSAGIFFDPASAAAVPDVVGSQQLIRANGLLSATVRLVRLVGRALGGVLVQAVGIVVALAVNALSFFISSSATAAAHIPVLKKDDTNVEWSFSSLKRDIREGLRTIQQSQTLSRLILLAAIANFGGGLITGLLPVLVRSSYHSGAGTYAGLLGVAAIGELVASATLATAAARVDLRASLVFSLVVSGATYLVVPLISSWTLAGALFFVQGFALAVGSVPIRTLLQASTPSASRGRVFTAFVIVVNVSSPLAVLVGSVAAEVLGVSVPYLAAGAIVIVTGIWATVRFRPSEISVDV